MLNDRQRGILTRTIGAILVISGMIMALLTLYHVGGEPTFAKWLVSALFGTVGLALAFLPLQMLNPLIDWLRVRGL